MVGFGGFSWGTIICILLLVEYDRLFQPKRYKLLLISDNIQISHEYVWYSCMCMSTCTLSNIIVLMWLFGGGGGNIYLFNLFFEFKIIDASTE